MASLNKKTGFTIVELLVVIVVIGILAAVSIVAYIGVSQKAAVASIQSDLTSSASKLKLYYTDNGAYPTSITETPSGSNVYCPTPVDTRYCLKLSSANSLDYYSGDGTDFILIVKNLTNTNLKYQITSTTTPSIVVALINPTDIAGCKLWLDATQMVADGNAVNDGDAVSTWTDHSGNGTSATQAGSAGLKPTYRTNVQNGKPVVRFDGSSDYLAHSMSLDGAGTFFIVYKLNSTLAINEADELMGYLGTGGKSSRVVLINTAGYTTNVWMHDGTTGTPTGVGMNPTLDATNFNIHNHTYTGSLPLLATSYTAHYNGGTQAVTTVGAFARPSTGSIGARIMAGPTIDSYLDGDIAEIIVYSSALTTAQIASVNQYLMSKWQVGS